MEFPILIAPLICLPTIKASHALEKGQETAKGKASRAKAKKAKPSKGK